MTDLNALKGNDAVEALKKDSSVKVIFGAGIVGEAMLTACEHFGIEVACFCDNKATTKKLKNGEKEALHPTALREKYGDDICFLISAADIHDITREIKTLGFSKWMPVQSILGHFDIYKHNFTQTHDFVDLAINTATLCHESFTDPDKVFIRSVDLQITESCSLKCVDCSNLMQFYEKAIHCETPKLMKSIDALTHYVDEVHEIRVLGGEPFMNKDCYQIVDNLAKNEKIKKVIIYTNGTICPNEKQLEYLKNSKVFVLITSYGSLSRNQDKLSKVLEENNIGYKLEAAHGWTKCGEIIKHDRSMEDQQVIFERCCAKTTISLSEDGKLYRCPFVPNALRLKAIPEIKSDYVDLGMAYESDRPLQKVKKEIQHYLTKIKFLGSCDYCNGRSFEDPEITPGIQTKKPLKFNKYTAEGAEVVS